MKKLLPKTLVALTLAGAGWLAHSQTALAYTGASVNIQDGKAGSMVDWAHGYIVILVNVTDSNLAATCFHPKTATPSSFTCAYGTDDLAFGLGAAPGTPDSMRAEITFVGNAGSANCDTAPVCSGPNGVPGSRPADILVTYTELPFGGSRALGTRNTNSGPLAINLAGLSVQPAGTELLLALLGAALLGGAVLLRGRRRMLRGVAPLALLGLLITGGGLAWAAAQNGVWVDTGFNEAENAGSTLKSGSFSLGSGQTQGSAVALSGSGSQWSLDGLTVAAVQGAAVQGDGKILLSAMHNRYIDVGWRKKISAQLSGGTLTLKGRTSNNVNPWSSDGSDIVVSGVTGTWETLAECNQSGAITGATTGILTLTGQADGRTYTLSASYTAGPGSTAQLDRVALQIQ